MALLAAVVLMPLVSQTLSEGRAYHDFQRLGQCALMLGAAVWLLLQRVRQLPRPSPRTSVLLGAAAAWPLLSSAMAWQPLLALREVALYAGLVGIGVVFAGADHATATARRLVLAATAGLAVYGCLVIGVYIVALAQGQPWDRWTMFIGYDNPRFFNHVESVALPLCAAVGVAERGRHGRWSVLAWLGGVLGWALVIVVAARATALAVVAGLAFAALAAPRSSGPLLKQAAVSCVLGSLVYWLLFVRWPLGLDTPSLDGRPLFGELGSDHSRYLLWGTAWAQLVHAPWFGIGGMHLAHHLGFKAAHPHDVYLQIAAEFGLPELAVLLILAVSTLWRLAVRVRRDVEPGRRAMGAGLLAACVAIGVDGSLSGNFVMPLSQMWIAMTLGASIAWANEKTPSPPVPGGDARRAVPARMLSILLVASQLALFTAAAYEWTLPRPEMVVGRAGAAVPQGRDTQRFWSNGAF